MTCQQCGAELISKHFNAKFCAECKAERMRESVRKFRKKPGKTCQTCGEPLTSQHCNARYCADCKAARIRIATAKAAKKHRDAKKTHVPGSGIREIAAKARSVGMSYGEYVAMKGAAE